MRLTRPLDEVLGNKTKLQILRTFFQYPGEYTGRHVARLARLPHANVQKQLQVLADNNILLYKYVGNSRVFSLNNDSILHEPLKELFQSESKILPKLENLIKQALCSNDLRNRLAHASIYGSVSRGEEQAKSDIDLLLILRNQADKRIINRKLEDVSQQVMTISGMVLHPYIRSLDDLRKENQSLLHDIRDSHRLICGKTIEELVADGVDKAHNARQQ